MDKALDAIIENGTYAEISEKYFGRDLLDVDLEGITILE